METVTSYIAEDGTAFSSKDKAREHNARIRNCVHPCPKCNTTGTIPGPVPIIRSVYDEEATAHGGQFASRVYREVHDGFHPVPCDLCRGVGWTQAKKEPVTEVKTIGWR